MTVVSLASALCVVYLWLKAGGAKFCFDRDLSQNIFKKMWPVATAVIFNAIYLQGDKVILPLFVSQAQMGLYGAAYREVDLVAQTSAMIMGIMMPLISYAFVHGLKEKFCQYLQTSFDLVSLIVLPMSAGLVALAVPIMVLIAGPQFAYAGIILQLLSLVVLGIVFGMVFGYTAIAINRQNKTMWIFISDAVMSLIGYVIFIPLYGIWGAVGVSIFSEFYAGFGLMKVSLYYAQTKISFKPFFKILFSSLLMGLTVYFIDAGNLFLSIILGIILYIGLILALQAVPIQAIRQTLYAQKIENKGKTC
jgi:O-antigen/teichoic acid export membrane protein